MGYYIETSANKGKAKLIVDAWKGQIVPRPTSFESIPADKALVCVVNNGPFEATGVIYSPGEFQAFTDPRDSRERVFLLLDKEVAYNLSNLPKDLRS